MTVNVKITDAKGLVQTAGGTGFEADSLPKVVYTAQHSHSTFSFAAANNVALGAGNNYEGGKYVVLHGKTAKYQMYFSKITNVDQTVPAKLPGHVLVAIPNIAAINSAAATVAAAFIDALPAEFNVPTDANPAIVMSDAPQEACGIDNAGTAPVTVAQVARGSGEGTVALKTSGVNHVIMSAASLNADGTGAPDVAALTLANGAYPGQECTIVRTDADDAVLHVVVNSMRDLDGGGIDGNGTIKWPHDGDAPGDGSPLIKLLWDGVAWQALTPGSENEFGWDLV